MPSPTMWAVVCGHREPCAGRSARQHSLADHYIESEAVVLIDLYALLGA